MYGESTHWPVFNTSWRLLPCVFLHSNFNVEYPNHSTATKRPRNLPNPAELSADHPAEGKNYTPEGGHLHPHLEVSGNKNGTCIRVPSYSLSTNIICAQETCLHEG